MEFKNKLAEPVCDLRESAWGRRLATSGSRFCTGRQFTRRDERHARLGQQMVVALQLHSDTVGGTALDHANVPRRAPAADALYTRGRSTVPAGAIPVQARAIASACSPR